MAATTTKLKLALLDNGIDFLRKAVSELHPDSTCGCDPFECDNHKWPEPDPFAGKYAVMHAYAGVVLLLKEFLRRKNPDLLKQPTPFDPNATVTYHKLLVRLSGVGYSVPISTRMMLDAVRKLRNPFEHFEVELDKADSERMVAEIIEFSYNFLADELKVRLEDHVPIHVWLRVQELQSVAARIEAEQLAERGRWWKNMLAKYSNLGDEDLERLAQIETYHPKHNPDGGELHHCPHCFEWSVVCVERGAVAICTNKDCRETFETDYCKRCGELLLDRTDFCENCEFDLFNDD
jgi:hypothetical protein